MAAAPLSTTPNKHTGRAAVLLLVVAVLAVSYASTSAGLAQATQ